MEAKIIACVLTGIFLGPVASLAVTPIVALLSKIFYVPIIRKRLLEDAIQKGHVIEATLQKQYDDYVEDPRLGRITTNSVIGIYTYSYNGKKRKYRVITSTRLSEKIKLYYIKNPKRATVSNDLGVWETPWLKMYLVISLLIAIITFLVGMIIW